jgi:hypothetical protein
MRLLACTYLLGCMNVFSRGTRALWCLFADGIHWRALSPTICPQHSLLCCDKLCLCVHVHDSTQIRLFVTVSCNAGLCCVMSALFSDSGQRLSLQNVIELHSPRLVCAALLTHTTVYIGPALLHILQQTQIFTAIAPSIVSRTAGQRRSGPRLARILRNMNLQ